MPNLIQRLLANKAGERGNILLCGELIWVGLCHRPQRRPKQQRIKPNDAIHSRHTRPADARAKQSTCARSADTARA